MHHEYVPAEAAAWAVGITTKNVVTLVQRGILIPKLKEPTGSRKHLYFLGWDEVCFLAVLVAFQKQFRILYRHSLKWKKTIVSAMQKNASYLVIKDDGNIEPLSFSITGGIGNKIDLNKFMNTRSCVFLNIVKIRSELFESLKEWEKRKGFSPVPRFFNNRIE